MSLLAALALLAAQSPAPETYRAIGAGPLWQAAVGNNYMSFETTGVPATNVEAPARQDNAQGFSWRTSELTINVTHGDCTDALTGRVYADRVTVESGGRRYEGCGGAPRGWTRPEPYWAAGGEPFWSLEIADGRLYFGVNEDVFIVPLPDMVATRDLRTRHYRAPGISVTLREEECGLEDERIYADAVTVRAGQWRVEGCGGRVVREAPDG
jgi:uncharacterized membrane protein